MREDWKAFFTFHAVGTSLTNERTSPVSEGIVSGSQWAQSPLKVRLALNNDLASKDTSGRDTIGRWEGTAVETSLHSQQVQLYEKHQ